MSAPLISVIMPVYNTEKYLNESIQSILNQTFKNFEFIIINDGSSDNSEKIIFNFAKKDKRIIYLKNDKNLGVSESVNKGIKIARGKYIARMDSDDISPPNRFQIQYKFMENNPKVGVCGGYVKAFGYIKKIWKVPSTYDRIKISMLFGCPIMNPTTFIRKEIIDKTNIKYNRNFDSAEDYEFWSRLIFKTRFINLKKIFLFYRIYSPIIRKNYLKKQKMLSDIIKIRFLKRTKFVLLKNEIKLLLKMDYHLDKIEIDDMINIKTLFYNIIEQNKKIKFISETDCIFILLRKFYEICSVKLKNDPKYVKNIFLEFFNYVNHYTNDKEIKIFMKFYLRYFYNFFKNAKK